MINFSGTVLTEKEVNLSTNNRAFNYGDALFETLKVKNNRVIFAEDHYFRLMASMRMLRMQIPMYFTQEFFINEIIKTVRANNLINARVRFTIFRKDGGLYLPDTNAVDFIVKVNPLIKKAKKKYEVDIFKDHYVNSGILSTLKTNNKILNVIASVYASENELDNCILINEKKNLVEAINSNVFLVKDTVIYTPSLTEGCLKGILRKKIIELVTKDEVYTLVEKEISPFELQKMDEAFLTNVISGIQPITNYRKKIYKNNVSEYFSEKLVELENNF